MATRGESGSSTQPNILFLMADQMQAQVLDPDHVCQTPNLDRMAVRGVRFTRAYTPNNICSPSRASLMTGLMPHNHGVLEVLYPKVPDLHALRPDKPHWAQRLVDAGYRTGYFGKWHVERTNELNRFGWQVDGGHESSLFQTFSQETVGDLPMQSHPELPARAGGRRPPAIPPCDPIRYLDEPPGYGPHPFYGVTDRAAEERSMGLTTSMALRFLQEEREKPEAERQPWCCFVSLFEPHDPYVAGRETFKSYINQELPPPPSADDDLADRPGLYRRAQRIWRQLAPEEKREARACYYSSISEIDGQFGRLLDYLEASGQWENTVIVMTADHGDLLGAHGLFFKDISAFEEIFRIPLIVSGPGVAENTVCEGRVGLHDFCPTLLELAGCEPLDVIDSQSFAELLRHPEVGLERWQRGYAEYYGNRYRLTQRVVWDGPWKYVFNGFDFDELYNLEMDPHELVNLADDRAHAERLVQMTALFWDYAHQTGDFPRAETFYPALRLGAVGPLYEADSTDKA